MATSVALRRGAAALPWRFLLRVAAVVAAVYGVVVFVLAPLTGHFSGQFEDFGAYLGAARAALAHGDIYAAFTHQQQNVALSGFDYPPAVAIVLMPLGLLSSHAAAQAWLLLDVVATFAGALIVCRAVLPRGWPRLELALLATFVWAPSTYNLWHGQMNPVVFLLLALALRSWVRGEEVRCGALLGAAAAIKLAPVVLVLLLIRRGWWRGVATGGAVVLVTGAAGVAVFGVHTTVEYVRSVLPVLSRGDGWFYNQSWAGIVNRLADHSVLTFQPDSLVLRAATVSLAVAGAAAAAWCVRRHEPADAGRRQARRAAEFGAGTLAMVLAGTLTWYAQDIHLLIPLAGAAALAGVTAWRSRIVAGAAVVVLVAAGVLAPLLIADASMTLIAQLRSGPVWWPVLQLASVPALAAAGLLAVLVTVLRHDPPGVVGNTGSVVDSKCELRNSHFRTAAQPAGRVG